MMEGTKRTNLEVRNLQKWERCVVLLMVVISVISMGCSLNGIGDRFILNVISYSSNTVLLISASIISCILRRKKATLQKQSKSLIGPASVIYLILASTHGLGLYDTIAQTDYLYKIYESGLFFLY